MPVVFRPFQAADLDRIKAITVESFEGVTIEEDIEKALGVLGGHDWRWRKARHIDNDIAAQADGIFVAECDDVIVGYVSTRIDREAGSGRIPNLAVTRTARGRGIGRRLIEYALDHFRAQGLQFALIETMAQNVIGNRLYPDCGFIEVARQVHYARRL